MRKSASSYKEGVTVLFLAKDLYNENNLYIPKNLIMFSDESRFIKYLFIRGIHTFTVPAEVNGLPRIFIVFAYSKHIYQIIFNYNIKIPKMGRKPWSIFSISRARVEKNVSKVLVIVLNSYDLLPKMLDNSDDLKKIVKKIAYLFDSWYILRFQKRGVGNFLKSIYFLLCKPWQFPPALHVEKLKYDISKVLYKDILNEPYVDKIVTSIGAPIVNAQQLYAVLLTIVITIILPPNVIAKFLTILKQYMDVLLHLRISSILSGMLFGIGFTIAILLVLYVIIVALAILKLFNYIFY